ncbi:unnamed protein product [Urochloa humidicola]
MASTPSLSSTFPMTMTMDSLAPSARLCLIRPPWPRELVVGMSMFLYPKPVISSSSYRQQNHNSQACGNCSLICTLGSCTPLGVCRNASV